MAGVSNEVTVKSSASFWSEEQGTTVEAYNGFVHLMKVTDGGWRGGRESLRLARQGQRP